MLGKGAMVFWHDFAPGADVTDYHEWHSKEHMEERVRVPGFRRGQRYVRVDDQSAADVFMMYDVDDLDVLVSKPYLERLNDPTPWTRRSMDAFANNNRTLCRVIADLGQGITGFCLTVQLSPDGARRDDLRARLADEVLPRLLERAGIVAASLLEGDPAASHTETEEKRIRKAPDQVADWVLIVRGYDPDALGTVRDGELSADALRTLGAAERQAVGLYRLLHCITDVDLTAET